MSPLFNNKKTRYRNLALAILPFVLILAFCGFKGIDTIKAMTGGGDPVKGFSYNIDEYDYHLRSDATAFQKTLFEELEDLVAAQEKDDLALATSVVKNYIADFYTWSNKAGQYDVGGLFYVYSPQKRAIYQQARDSFYHYLSTYINEYGSENLLEVDSIEIKSSSDGKTYDTDRGTFPGYYVHATWTYKPNATFPTDGYMNEGYFMVIKNADQRYEIVEAYGND